MATPTGTPTRARIVRQRRDRDLVTTPADLDQQPRHRREPRRDAEGRPDRQPALLDRIEVGELPPGLHEAEDDQEHQQDVRPALLRGAAGPGGPLQRPGDTVTSATAAPATSAADSTR